MRSPLPLGQGQVSRRRQRPGRGQASRSPQRSRQAWPRSRRTGHRQPGQAPPPRRRSHRLRAPGPLRRTRSRRLLARGPGPPPRTRSHRLLVRGLHRRQAWQPRPQRQSHLQRGQRWHRMEMCLVLEQGLPRRKSHLLLGRQHRMGRLQGRRHQMQGPEQPRMEQLQRLGRVLRRRKTQFFGAWLHQTLQKQPGRRRGRRRAPQWLGQEQDCQSRTRQRRVQVQWRQSQKKVPQRQVRARRRGRAWLQHQRLPRWPHLCCPSCSPQPAVPRKIFACIALPPKLRSCGIWSCRPELRWARSWKCQSVLLLLHQIPQSLQEQRQGRQRGPRPQGLAPVHQRLRLHLWPRMGRRQGPQRHQRPQ